MPKTKSDYSRTVIYKIVCNDLSITDFYIGRTTEFTKRKCQHKGACNRLTDPRHNYHVYKFIRENGDWSNWSMVEIETYPCSDSNESKARERYLYEHLKPSLNTQMSFRLPKESKQNYYNRNKENILIKNNERFKCICGSSFSHCNKQQHLRSNKHQDYINSLV